MAFQHFFSIIFLSLFCYTNCSAAFGKISNQILNRPKNPLVIDLDTSSPEVGEFNGCPHIPSHKFVHLKEMMGQWHLPYMSYHWIRSMSKSMHKKFSKPSSSGRSCIKLNVEPIRAKDRDIRNATIWVQSKRPRTGAEMNMYCNPTGRVNQKWFCVENDGRGKDVESIINIVNTDNKSWALIVRCFPSIGMKFAILSKEKILDKKLVKILFQDVKDLGFKLHNIVEIPSHKCF